MADAHIHSSREQLRERRQLHRLEGYVAHGRGQDADAHSHSPGGRQNGGRLRDPAPEAQVFDDPELVEAEVVDASGELEHLIGGQVAGEDDALLRERHGVRRCSHVSRVSRSRGRQVGCA
jgi:hypothetical protein